MKTLLRSFAFAFSLIAILKTDAEAFSFPNFSSTIGLTLVGDAAQNGNTILLTPNQYNKVGGAWYSIRQQVSTTFSTAFRFRLSGGGSGDGIAFTIQNVAANALGSNGGGKGYAGLTNCLAVEVDTWVDQEIAVQSKGTQPNDYRSDARLGSYHTSSSLADGQIHTLRIVYMAGKLDVFLDTATAPVVSIMVDLSTFLGLTDGQAWVGLTGATGASGRQVNEVLDWSFTARGVTPEPTFVTQPADRRVELHKIANFTAVAEAVSPYQYQWFRSAQPDDAGQLIPGAVSGTLNITPQSDADYAYYFVRVTDGEGRTADSRRAQLSKPVKVGGRSKVNVPRVRPGPGLITFAGNLTITMTCTTPDAKIYYTLDGSPPDRSATSKEYKPETPPVISTTSYVRAIGTRDDLAPSSPSALQVYLKNADDDQAPGILLGTLDNNRLLSSPLEMIGNDVMGASADLVDHVSFRLLKPQTVHWSVSHLKNSAAVDASVVVDLLAEDGSTISGANRPRLGIVREDSRQLSAGLYSLRIGFLNPDQRHPQTNYIAAISGGADWGIVADKDRPRKVQHVGLYTYDGSSIQDNTHSWLVVHGRVDSPFSPSIYKLATMLNGAETAVPQTLFLDWETAAADNTPIVGLEGRKWIPAVAQFASARLKAHSISGDRLNVAGHSWGSYVSRQLAYDLMVRDQSAKPKRLVALDPALIGSGETNESTSPEYFRRVAQRSWAIHGINSPNISGLFGNIVKTRTAHDSFIFLTPNSFDWLQNHLAPVEAWANMIRAEREGGGTAITAKFFPDQIFGVAGAGTWTENQCKIVLSLDYTRYEGRQRPVSGTTADFPFEGVLTLNEQNMPQSAGLLPNP